MNRTGGGVATPVALALALALAGACRSGGAVEPAQPTSSPAYTFTVLEPGDAYSDQAVEAHERWYAHTGPAHGSPGDANAALRTLFVTPLSDGRPAVAADANGVVRVDVDEATAQLGGLRWAPMQFSPDGRLLALAAPVQVVRLDASSGSSTSEVGPAASAPDCFAYAMAFGADGRQLAAACGDGLFRVWDLDDLEAPTTATSLASGVPAAAELGAAALASLVDQGWRLLVAGDRVPLRIIDVGGAEPSVVDLGSLGMPATPGARLALNPLSAAQVFFLGSASSATFSPRLTKTQPPYTSDSVFQVPAQADGGATAHFGPDGSLALAQVRFRADAVALAGTPDAWTGMVAWTAPDGVVEWTSSHGAVPLTGNTATYARRVFAWLAADGPTVGIWQL